MPSKGAAIPSIGELSVTERQAALATDRRLARLEGRRQGNAYTSKRPPEGLTGDLLADDAVTEPKLADAAVARAKIQLAAVNADLLDAGAVIAGKIAPDAVEVGNIGENVVTAREIVANSITADEIQAGAISTDELAADAIFAGTLDAVDGTFTGELVAADGTFTGTLTAADGTFTGTLAGVDGSFAGDVTAETFTLVDGAETVAQLYTSDTSFQRLRMRTNSVAYPNERWDIAWRTGSGEFNRTDFFIKPNIGLNPTDSQLTNGVGFYASIDDLNTAVTIASDGPQLALSTPGFASLSSGLGAAVNVSTDITCTQDTDILGALTVSGGAIKATGGLVQGDNGNGASVIGRGTGLGPTGQISWSYKQLRSGHGGGSSKAGVAFWTGNTAPQLSVDANTNTINVLDASGTVFVTLKGVISNVSDERLKQNIATSNSGLSDVMQMRPVEFQYTPKVIGGVDGPHDCSAGPCPDPCHIHAEWAAGELGFISQEMGLIDERYTNRDADGVLSAISVPAILSSAVKAIQELSAKVEALETQVDGLLGGVL